MCKQLCLEYSQTRTSLRVGNVVDTCNRKTRSICKIPAKADSSLAVVIDTRSKHLSSDAQKQPLLDHTRFLQKFSQKTAHGNIKAITELGQSPYKLSLLFRSSKEVHSFQSRQSMSNESCRKSSQHDAEQLISDCKVQELHTV